MTWSDGAYPYSTATYYTAAHLSFATSCRHKTRAMPMVGKRHAEVVCLECSDVLARVRVEPPAAPLVLRAVEPKPVRVRPTKQRTFARSFDRRHRASPRRFARCA